MNPLKSIFFLIILFIFFGTHAQSFIKNSTNNSDLISVYDIQFTEDPYGVSPYEGETVDVIGIVTSSAQDYDLGFVYIQDEGGGPWSGILLYGSGLAQFYRGEEISVTGVVKEDWGMTYISVTEAELTGNYKNLSISDLDPSDSTTFITNGWEKWESCLIRYKDPGDSKLYFSQPAVNNYGDYAVSTMGSKAAKKLGIILAGRQTSQYFSSLWVQLVTDSAWANNSGTMMVGPIETATWMEMDAVVGLLFYSYGDYHLTPRNNDDFININVELDTTDLPLSPLAAIPEINQIEFNVYPNPASDVVHIISETEPISHFELYDLRGRQLMQKQINSKQVEVDVSALKTGMYVLVVHTDKHQAQSARVYVVR